MSATKAATGADRNRETAKTAGAVRVQPGHWAARSVHAFRRWTGEQTVETWCGLSADLSTGASLTADTITCQGCPEASLRAFTEGGMTW